MSLVECKTQALEDSICLLRFNLSDMLELGLLKYGETIEIRKLWIRPHMGNWRGHIDSESGYLICGKVKSRTPQNLLKQLCDEVPSNSYGWYNIGVFRDSKTEPISRLRWIFHEKEMLKCEDTLVTLFENETHAIYREERHDLQSRFHFEVQDPKEFIKLYPICDDKEFFIITHPRMRRPHYRN